MLNGKGSGEDPTDTINIGLRALFPARGSDFALCGEVAGGHAGRPVGRRAGRPARHVQEAHEPRGGLRLLLQPARLPAHGDQPRRRRGRDAERQRSDDVGHLRSEDPRRRSRRAPAPTMRRSRSRADLTADKNTGDAALLGGAGYGDLDVILDTKRVKPVERRAAGVVLPGVEPAEDPRARRAVAQPHRQRPLGLQRRRHERRARLDPGDRQLPGAREHVVDHAPVDGLLRGSAERRLKRHHRDVRRRPASFRVGSRRASNSTRATSPAAPTRSRRRSRRSTSRTRRSARPRSPAARSRPARRPGRATAGRSSCRRARRRSR
jgi:hypothetical protein